MDATSPPSRWLASCALPATAAFEIFYNQLRPRQGHGEGGEPSCVFNPRSVGLATASIIDNTCAEDLTGEDIGIMTADGLTKDDIVGIFPPLYTPFTKSGELDLDGFRQDIDYLLQFPVTGLVVGGSTGEGHALERAEHIELTRIAVEHVAGRVPIMTGIISTSTREAVARAQGAKAVGARAVMVTPPIYQSANFAGLIDFYDRIRKEGGLPVTIYNVLAHNPVTPAVTRRLAEIGAIVATKESVGGSLATLSELIDTVGDAISVTWAQDHLLFPGLAMGASGSISGTGAMFPAESIAMFEAIKRNDFAEAQRIHYALWPVTRAVMNGQNWPAWVKAVAELQGRRVGQPRRPFVPLTSEELEQLEAGLEFAKKALSSSVV